MVKETTAAASGADFADFADQFADLLLCFAARVGSERY